MRRSAVAAVASALAHGCAAAVRRLWSSEPLDEEIYRAMFEDAGVGNARVDLATGRTVAVNPALCRLLGYDRDELLAKTLADVTHPDDRAAQAELLGRLARGEIGRFECERRFVHKSGKIVSSTVHVSALHDARGEPRFAIGTVHDVTERRRTEDALRASEERYRVVSRVIADAVYEWNLTTDAVEWSVGVLTLFDYGADQVGADASWWSARVHPDDREHVFADIAAAIAGDGDGWVGEYRFLRRDGSYASVVDRAYIDRDRDGKALHLVGAMVDVTEQRALEAEREHLLAREMAARSTRTQRRAALESIHCNARHQNQLVGDLLDVSSIVSGKLRLNVAPADLASVVERALDAVRFSADAKGIRLDSRLDAPVGAVHCDADRLQQVFWNLLANAVKFTPAGGSVTVTLRAAGSKAEVEVRDDGQGIEPALLPRVFERFWQGETAPSRQRGGLGLGLAIVRHLVELHGGDVSAHSDGPGRGATFRVRLPRLAAGATPPAWERTGSEG